jgi:hypothetical protein
MRGHAACKANETVMRACGGLPVCIVWMKQAEASSRSSQHFPNESSPQPAPPPCVSFSFLYQLRAQDRRRMQRAHARTHAWWMPAASLTDQIRISACSSIRPRRSFFPSLRSDATRALVLCCAAFPGFPWRSWGHRSWSHGLVLFSGSGALGCVRLEGRACDCAVGHMSFLEKSIFLLIRNKENRINIYIFK